MTDEERTWWNGFLAAMDGEGYGAYRVRLENALRELDKISPGAAEYVMSKFLEDPTTNSESLLDLMGKVQQDDPYNSRRNEHERELALALALMKTMEAMAESNNLATINANFYDETNGVTLESAAWNSLIQAFQSARPKSPIITNALFDAITQSNANATAIQNIHNGSQHPTREVWSNVNSDPMNHDPTNFTYLITAMRMQPASIIAASPAGQYALHNMPDVVTVDPTDPTKINVNYGLLMLRHPERLQSELISTSLISHENAKTYKNMNFGFILKAPGQNIVLTATSDASVANVQDAARPHKLAGMTKYEQQNEVTKFVGELGQHYSKPVTTPDVLLEHTPGYNEVVVLGNLNGSKVTPQGIFIKVGSNRNLPADFMADNANHNVAAEIMATAQRLNLPIIPIIDPLQTESTTHFHDIPWNAHLAPSTSSSSSSSSSSTSSSST